MILNISVDFPIIIPKVIIVRETLDEISFFPPILLSFTLSPSLPSVGGVVMIKVHNWLAGVFYHF